MSLTPVLAGLYPRPVRERWGPDLNAEIRVGGWRALPNTVAGAVHLWLHPAIWPDASPRRSRLRATTMATAVTLTCWLISLATAELGGHTARAAGHSVLMSAGMVLIGTGLVFLSPRPTLRALAATCRIALTRLAAPATLAAGVIIAAHAGAGGAPPVVRAALLFCWWTALALGAFQTCRAIAAAGPYVIPPRIRRLRAGAAIVTAGAAANAAALLGFPHSAGEDLSATVTGLGLLGLLVAFGLVLRDTHHFTADE